MSVITEATLLFTDAETRRNNNVAAETSLFQFNPLADICGPFLRAKRVETLQWLTGSTLEGQRALKLNLLA